MPSKSLSTRSLGRTVARDAKNSLRSKLHVISKEPKDWVVVRGGNVRVMASFPMQVSAVAFAKKSASTKSIATLIVHDKDGSVIKRISI